MRPIFIFVFLATVIASPLVRAQAVLDKTTLGQSQNDDRDLANSLVPGPQRYGKGEKKSQIKAAELKSKTIHDATFGGSLLNMGIGSAAQPKLDETKLRNAQTEVETQPSAAPKQSTAATEKDATKAKEPAEDSGQRSEDRSAASEKDPGASTEPVESQPTFSNLSTTATLADNLAQADANAAPNQSKTTSASASDDPQKKAQSANAATDKSSTPKSDGDR